MAQSNLQSFLRRTTPSIPCKFLSKTPIDCSIPEWQFNGGKDRDHPVEFFTLRDLWDFYDEGSAYGVGSPLRLDDHETIVQYYTPFLSGIQLYSAKVNAPRKPVEDSEFETDSTCSDSSIRSWDLEDSGSDQDVDFKIKDRMGKLSFEYFEAAAPHLRLPLADMIDKLSEDYPELLSLRSIDLSPASWMAIAWYPIYHIPSQRNPKEVYSAFLTYHTLSSAFHEVNRPASDDVCKKTKAKDEALTISLPPFGLAAYKMQSRVWINPKTQDFRELTSLWRAAASWLRQLDARHPDFDFFNFHSS